MINKFAYLILFFFLFSCGQDSESNKGATTLHNFELLPGSKTGINFSNDLSFDRNFNIYTYRNFYNGGGVAIGDVDNDGFSDIYFTSNMGPNKLYKNRGNFKFEDITSIANVQGSRKWSTGVTMVDINHDGYLDIYVCNSGDVEGDNKENELFVNQGNGTFIETAKKYGLDDKGYSTHAVFFDYDKDGDLDCYLLNNSYQAIGTFNLTNQVRDKRDPVGGDKFFRNDGQVFIDVSEEVGIFGSLIGFGLGVTVGDVNNDGWEDIYVSNDFFEKDYLYINKQDGTFSEQMESKMNSISVASMGADMADMNNDGLPEIFVTEMLPSTDRRLKTKTTFEDWDKYQSNIKNGYYHQFTRNMLHQNDGQKFNEIGRLSGVEATDWSWGALIVDLDNDGLKDLFVANGIYQDLTDQDFINYIADSDVMTSMIKDNKVDYEKLIEAIPSERIPNHFFKNKDGVNFKDITADVSLDLPSHSNGAAYGDLDNDGDWDLVINNVNMPAFVYRNNASDFNGFIQFKLKYKDENKKGIGSKIKIYCKEESQSFEFMPMKGFQSCMQERIHFGIGNSDKVDSVVVRWPDLTISKYIDLKTDSLYTLDYTSPEKRNFKDSKKVKNSPIFLSSGNGLQSLLLHNESNYIDFDRERLLPHMKTNLGPRIEVEDINKDGLEDIVFPNASNATSKVLIQSKTGGFTSVPENVLETFKLNEDVEAQICDINNDGLLDIYFASGSAEFSRESSNNKDYILEQKTDGTFQVSNTRVLPSNFIVTSSVSASDCDGDGDIDFVLSEGVKPFQYGVACSAKILINQGQGRFEDVTQNKAPSLLSKGLYTDIKWADMNNDNMMDIVYAGHYMNIGVLYQTEDNVWNEYEGGHVTELTGWWNDIELSDVNGDGRLDVIAGNHGLNSRFKTSKEFPVCMHVNDFDRNGSVEQILCTYEGDKSYPIALRHDIIKQLPHLKKRFIKYTDYANKEMEDIFTEVELENMLTLKAETFENCVFINKENGFQKIDLPIQSQYSSVFASISKDFDGDGIKDILLGGNLYSVKPEFGRYDASRGIFLKGRKDGEYEYLANHLTGFDVDGEIRDLDLIDIGGQPHLIVSRNNQSAVLFQIKDFD